MRQLYCVDSGPRAKNSDGTRRRSGCSECRRRKRRCDERKPTCLRCAKSEASCTYPDPRGFSDIRIIISQGSEEDLLPLTQTGEVEFINLVSSDVPKLCSQYHVTTANMESVREEIWTTSAPHYRPSISVLLGDAPYGELEAQLIQYYFEIISTSRVYVPTKRNLFRSSVMPFLFRSRGPLFFAVVSLSAMERSRQLLVDAADYDFISHEYRAKSLSELQIHLADPQAAEENVMTCVLHASLEIARGSQPSWLLHLRGASAILRSFATHISPEVARFASRYFHFRYTLMKTTEFAEYDMPEMVDDAETDWLRTSLLPLRPSCRGREVDTVNIIDEHLGCSLEMVELIFYISEIGRVEAHHRHRGPSQWTSSSDFQSIYEKLQKMSFVSPETEGHYLLTSATCFKVAAELYLRLVGSNVDINASVILNLEERLLDTLSLAIEDNRPRRSFPMWPLFIAGCASFEDGHRKKVLGFFKTLDKVWPISNITTILEVVWTIWQTRDLCMHPATEQRRDWQEIIHKFGWKLALS